MSLIPRTSLTGYELSGGRFSDGKWIEGVRLPFSFTASVQPLRAREMEMLPEARRNGCSYRLYTSKKMKTVEENSNNPDLVKIEDEMYEVFSRATWKNQIIPHYKYIVVKLDIDESQPLAQGILLAGNHWNVLYSSRLAIDNTGENLLVFGGNSITFDVYSYIYSADGASLTLADTKNPGTPYCTGFAIDTIEKILFVGDASGKIFSYRYDSNGLLTLLNSIDTWDTVNDIAIDTTKKILITANGSGAGNYPVTLLTYTNSGILARVAWVSSHGINTDGCAIDISKLLSFMSGSGGGGQLGSYIYTPSTIVNSQLYSAPAGFGRDIKIDSDSMLAFLANDTSGVISYSYDVNGVMLLLDSSDMGGAAWDVCLDKQSKILFLANTSRGIETYKYDETNGELTHIDNNSTRNGTRVAVDTVNRIVFLTNTTGIDLYKYI